MANQIPQHSPYGSIRRVVTGHTPEGKSVVLDDSEPASHQLGQSRFTGIFRTDETPPSNAVEWVDHIKDKPKEPMSENGSVLSAVDIPPHSRSPFHRTVTLDYGTVMQGSIILLLDDDKRVTLKQGDVIVQRGTIHGWINENDEWTRLYCVMLPSQKVKIGDNELDGYFPSRPST